MQYEFNNESSGDIALILAQNIKKRRLEKGLSRASLSKLSGVPTPTIVKFENEAVISFVSFISLATELGYKDELQSLLSQAKFNTINELDIINSNKNRQRGQ